MRRTWRELRSTPNDWQPPAKCCAGFAQALAAFAVIAAWGAGLGILEAIS